MLYKLPLFFGLFFTLSSAHVKKKKDDEKRKWVCVEVAREVESTKVWEIKGSLHSMGSVCVYSRFTPAHCPRHNPSRAIWERRERKWSLWRVTVVHFYPAVLRAVGQKPLFSWLAERERAAEWTGCTNRRNFESMSRNMKDLFSAGGCKDVARMDLLQRLKKKKRL